MITVRIFSIASLFALAIGAAPAQAASVLITDLTQGATATLDYTATDTNVYGVTFDTNVSGQQSDFNGNWAIQNKSSFTQTSQLIQFGQLGYNAQGEFILNLDVQEPGNGVDLNIYGMKLEIGDSEANLAAVWELNAGQDYTLDQRIITDVNNPAFYSGTLNQIDLFSNGLTDNGNNANVLVKIPVELLISMSPEIRSDWLVKLTWLEADYAGGQEEWLLNSDTAGLTFLPPDTPLTSIVPVPVPAPALLLASGIGLIGFMRRRRGAKPDA